MKLNKLKLKKYYILVILSLMVCLSSLLTYKTMSKLEITSVDGHKITTDAYVLYPDHEFMLAKDVAEQVLNARIGWEKQTPLPEGIYYKDQVAVLMYHHLTEESLSLYPGVLSAEQFDEQMRLLKEEGFQVITMEQYRRFMLENAPVPDNAVLLTFDDGYESFYKLAFPILQKHGYTAINFIIVSDVDNPDGRKVPKLTWEQMREMKRAGMGFYNHTYNLHYYGIVDAEGGTRPSASALLYIDDENRNELNEEYYRRVTGDLALAERRLKEELGNTDSAIAFPYGSYNEKLLDASDSLGIKLKFNTREGLSSRTNLNAPRINEGDETLTAALSIEQLKHTEPLMELTVNSRKVPLIETQPHLRNGKLMVPLGPLSRSLGIEMHYDRRSRTLKLTHSSLNKA
ncbi:polysaccharide deacetylase family protein [Paenibacillus odorifer]|uniref:Polysaccharide deacetylase n=1 Tax=Paenibacillus odorifer TaxID=189426 RepID=A0AAD0KNS1_9BACL|nr:polysaccharide deacetylase family protein [Paenibacillus odorifer]AWV35916.1 polysaccharide deacetylase [Paenibacillus odorifer]